MQPSWKAVMSLALFVFLSSPAKALDPNYNFSIVAINGQTIDGLELTSAFGPLQPCINDSGEIVFMGSYLISPGDYGSALFTRHRVIVKAGDKIDGEVLENVSGCALNNFGEVLFQGGFSSGKAALYRKQGLFPATRVAVEGETIDGLEIQTLETMAINDLGEIAFYAFYTGKEGSGGGIFTPHAVLVAQGCEVDHYVLSSIDPMFALSSRQLFFHANNASIGEGIFTLHRLLVKSGDVISGLQLIPVGSSAFGYLAASDRGRVVFGATYDGGSGIFTPEAIVATTGGQLPEPSAVNDAGTVVYGGPEGLIVNQTPLVDSGDSIDGHIINGFALPPGINNRGAVVFVANFTDGEGIVLASPKR